MLQELIIKKERVEKLGHILVTNEEGKVFYVNDGVTQKTGFATAEILDSKPGKLWGGKMPREFYEKMWRSIREERRLYRGNVTNTTKSGKTYQDLLTIAPLQKSTGEWCYIALQPALLREEERALFLDEWEKVFRKPNVSAAHAEAWFRRWLPADAAKSINWSGRFMDWVEIHWAETLRAKFQKRSDDRLLILAAQEDAREFRSLYQKYYPIVYRYFLRHLFGQSELARDLTQDVFLRAFERLDMYEIRNASYGTYLLRIAHSVLLNTFRREEMLSLPDEFTAIESSYRTPELEWVWDAQELTSTERCVLSAYYREGYSIREISSGLEKSENAIKLILSRARKKIRPLLLEKE